MDTSVSRQMVIKLAGMSESQKVSTVSNNHCLTAREQEILKLLAEGMSTGIVAVKLFISQKTVENHRSNIMHKLGLHSTIELIRYAAKTGLIDLTDWKES